MSSNSTNEIDEMNCMAAYASVHDFGYNIVRAAQLILGIITTILLWKILWVCKKWPVKLHGNLIILLVIVLILYGIYVGSFLGIVIRNFILLAIEDTIDINAPTKSPCQWLNPVWLVYLLRLPFYVYIAASPMFHFAIMAEWVWATVYIRSYERQGHKYGIASAAVVWSITFLFGIYVFLSTIEDPDGTFSRPMVYFTLTSKSNSQVLINVHYFFLLLVLCISIADYVLIRMNRKIKTNFSSPSTVNYSLSRSYQANENILTMRIIFPLDFSYTFVFTLFNILSSFIRSKRDEYGQIVYMRTYEEFTLLLFCHAILTLIVYANFVESQQKRKRNEEAKMGQQKNAGDVQKSVDVYFKNLKSQWE